MLASRPCSEPSVGQTEADHEITRATIQASDESTAGWSTDRCPTSIPDRRRFNNRKASEPPKIANLWNERASFVLYAEEQVAKTKTGGPRKIGTRIVCHHLESGRQRSWRLTNLDRLPLWIAHMLKTDRANRPDASLTSI